MKVQIRPHNVKLTKALRAHVVRRLGFALSRFGERISRVTVRISDARSANKRCQVEVDLRPPCVRVEDSDADLLVAIDHAFHRVSRSVARALERERASDAAA